MITKTTAYKIYWAGRYLERIEDIARASLCALHSNTSLDSLAKEYGLNSKEEIVIYIKKSFEFLREDIRGFADESIMIQLNNLGFIIDSNYTDMESYFSSILTSVMALGSSLDNYFVERKTEVRISSQEENEPEEMRGKRNLT